jgi:hypothetical protein
VRAEAARVTGARSQAKALHENRQIRSSAEAAGGMGRDRGTTPVRTWHRGTPPGIMAAGCRQPVAQAGPRVDAGETAAILVAESLRADLLLIDEKIGRKVARARGLSVRGTLGVLVQARQGRLLPALKPVLDAIVAAGFRIARA